MAEELIKLKLDTTEAKRQVDDLRKQAAQGVAIDARVNAANMRSFQRGQQNEGMFSAAMVGLDGGGWGGRMGSAFSLGGYAAAGGAALGAAATGAAYSSVAAYGAAVTSASKARQAIGGTADSAFLAGQQSIANDVGNLGPIGATARGKSVQDVINAQAQGARLDQIAGVRDAVAARVDGILGPVAQGGRATVDKATTDAVTSQAIQEMVALAKQQADDMRSANEHLSEIAGKMGYGSLEKAATDPAQGAGSRR